MEVDFDLNGMFCSLFKGYGEELDFKPSVSKGHEGFEMRLRGGERYPFLVVEKDKEDGRVFLHVMHAMFKSCAVEIGDLTPWRAVSVANAVIMAAFGVEDAAFRRHLEAITAKAEEEE